MQRPAEHEHEAAPSPASDPPHPDRERARTRTREQEAEQSLPCTQVAPSVALALVLSFLLTVFSVPLIQWMSTGSAAGVAAPRSLTARALKNTEEALSQRSVVAGWLLPRTQAVLSGRLGAGNEQAYLGRMGRLYYRPDVDYVTGSGFLDPDQLRRRVRSGDNDGGGSESSAVQPDPLPALVQLRQDLAARGVRLVLLPVPVKPAIEPQFLARRVAAAPLQNPSYQRFLAEMAEQSIPVCDVTGALLAAGARMGQDPYLRTDTHWTPDAMELSAQVLATFIRTHVPLPPRPPIHYTLGRVIVHGRGDLAVMLKLPDRQGLYPPQPVETHPVRMAAGGPWRPDRGADVLLLGDSFTNVFSRPDLGWGEGAGLAEHLSRALGRPVDRIALNAGGSFAARQALVTELAQGRNRLAGKHLAVYEFSMRDLSGGNWKRLPLPPLGRPLGLAPGVSVVQGVVRAVTAAPPPGSTPYPDCIISLRLTRSKALSGNAPSGDPLVFLWGLRGGQPTPAASYAPGQEVTLRLVPWETVESRYDDYQRQEFEDIDVREKVYWAETEPGASHASGSAAPPQVREVVPPAAPPAQRRPVKNPEPVTAANPEPATAISPEQVTAVAAAYRRDLAARAGKAAVVGQGGWLFYGPELRSQSVGKFWGPDAYKASQALQPQFADPLQPILDFKRQLDRAGIELILVPVPAKVTVYPDMASPSVRLRAGQTPPRLDVYDYAFCQLLQAKGVHVLDLAPTFLRHRAAGGTLLYYKTDTHWTPTGCALAASEIAGQVRGRPWLTDVPKRSYAVSSQTIQCAGDLWRMLGDPRFPTERVRTLSVQEQVDQGIWPFRHTVQRPVADWPESPVVLLGDSYCDGLRDLLTQQLGFPLDVVTTPGSGGEHARISLARRGDLKSGKRLVIWCFSAREFTEELGWRKLPLWR